MKHRFIFLVIVTLFTSLYSGCTKRLQAVATTDCGQNNSRITAFTNVNLVPMTNEIILENQTVLIEGTTIAEINSSHEINIPECAVIIDGTGAYLIPGLADMHVHIYEESRNEYPVSPLNLYIAKGVTTIRDCGTAPLTHSDRFVLDWRDEIIRGETIGPMIYSSGRTIHGPVSNPGRIIRERYDDGFDFIKLYFELSMDEYKEAQVAAEELKMYTVGHIPYQVGFERAISAGLDEIAHLEELSFDLIFEKNRPVQVLSMDQWVSFMVGEIVDAYGYEQGSDFNFNPNEFNRIHGQRLSQILRDLKTNGIPVGTTLAVYEVVDQKLFKQDAFMERSETAYLPVELIEAVLKGQDKHQLLFQALGENSDAWFWKRDLDAYILQQLRKVGVLLVSGTDAGSSNIGVVEGFATHDDLRILTDSGYTPYEALQTATINAASVVAKMNNEGDFGTLEEGKRADLVMLGGNPLEDITNTQDILGVMAMGRWYPASILEQMISLSE